MKRFMAENVASLQSSREGGVHGYYAIEVSVAIYATVSETAWIDPPFPGVHPTFPPDPLTAAQCEHIICLFDKAKQEHQDFSNLQTALRKQLLEAIDPIYLWSINNRHTGLAQILIQNILGFLFRQYGTITDHKYLKNNEREKSHGTQTPHLKP